MGTTRTHLWTAVAAVSVVVVGCGGTPDGGELRLGGDAAGTGPTALIDDAEDARRISPELLELATNADALLRARVAEALGRIGGAEAAPALSELAGDSDARVREAALFACGLLGDDASDAQVELLLGRLDADLPAAEVALVLDALGRVGDAGIAERVGRMLDDERPVVRAAAIRALGFLGQRGLAVLDDVVARVADRLTDPEEPVRFMSAFALYRIKEPLPGPPEAVTALVRAASADESAEVRAYALRGLARRGGLDQATLLEALDDPDARVGGTAVSVIPLAAEEQRCPLAVAALGAVADRVVEEARLVAGEFAHTARAALEAAEPCVTDEQVGAAAERIETAVASLDRPRTAGAARVLCLARLLGGADQLALLACDAERPHAGKRMLARRLGQGAGTSVAHVERLVELAAEPDLRVTTAALYALGEIPDDRARRAVLEALADQRALAAAAALDAITYNPGTFRAAGEESRPGPALDGVIPAIAAAVDRLLPFEHAEAPLVSAAAALGALADDRAGPVLTKLAADPRPALRGAVLGAYEAIDGLDPPELLPPLRPPRPVSSADKQTARATAAVARVRTTRGDFRIRLRGDVAPATVGSFVSLAGTGYFDGTEIHRVVPNFVIQAGDPTGTGMGDPGYSLRCEVSPLPYQRGTVGMALAGKDTGGSQFFVAISRQPHLDGNYTVFGDVIEGMDVVDLIEEGDEIETISIKTEETP